MTGSPTVTGSMSARVFGSREVRWYHGAGLRPMADEKPALFLFADYFTLLKFLDMPPGETVKEVVYR